MDVRFDMNGVLNNIFSLRDLGEFVLRPLLRWAFEGLLLGEFDLDNIEDHGLTNKDQNGSRAEPKGIAKILFQLEGYLTHCKKGKNRTGMMLAAFLIAFFCESDDLSIDAVTQYCCEVRPILEFMSHDEYGCPMVPRGGDHPEKPVQSVERSNLYSNVWSSRQVCGSEEYCICPVVSSPWVPSSA